MDVLRWRRGTAWALAAGLAWGSVLVTPGPAPAISRTVTGSCAGGCSWKPSAKSVGGGVRVVWRVPGGDVRHSLVALKGPSARWRNKDVTLDPGSRTSFRFRRPGRYTYYCDLHPATMRGRIRVRR